MTGEGAGEEKLANRRDFFRRGISQLGESVASVMQHQLKRFDTVREMAGIRGVPFVTNAGGTAEKGDDRSEGDAHEGTAGAAVSMPPMRPPGALKESTFLTTCDPECRQCVTICPRYCIVPSQLHHPGPDGYPILLPNRAACDLCMKCTEVCPTGALHKVAREDVWIGTALPIIEHCTAVAGSGCDRCVVACPFPDEAIRMLPLTNTEADRLASQTGNAPPAKPQVNGERCTGCGLCVEACPALPKAIEVIAWPEQ